MPGAQDCAVVCCHGSGVARIEDLVQRREARRVDTTFYGRSTVITHCGPGAAASRASAVINGQPICSASAT